MGRSYSMEAGDGAGCKFSADFYMTGAESIFLSDDFILCSPQFFFCFLAKRDGIMSRCTDLRVLVNLLGVLFVTVDVEPDGCSRAACAAETEYNSGAVREDDP